MAKAFADYCEAQGIKIIRKVPSVGSAGYAEAILQYYGEKLKPEKF
jgi:hypothetical protein